MKGEIMTTQQDMKELEAIINKDYGNTAGIVVLKDGEMQYEQYFNGCTAESRVHIYSVTKSIVSILIGIAMDKGFITDIDQKVLDFFPDYVPKQREKTIQNITLKHLLTMTAPYKYKIAPYVKYFTSDDMVTFTLDLLGGRGKPGQFRYAPLIGPDLLTGILKQAAGQSVFEFARENLFIPLKITAERSIVFHSKEEQLAFNKATDISGWVSDPSGTNTGGWGLTLSAADMAKLGQLYLNGGLWNGKPIVSAEWISESTKEHSRWVKENLAYGYLWWLHEDGFAAMGDGGNVIYVNMKKNLTVAIASLFKPRAKDRIDFIQNYIESKFQ